MSTMTRLWEKITGTPHLQRDSAAVAAVAQDVSASVQRASDVLRTYETSAKPFDLLMADLYEQRQVARLHEGPSR